jgi:hypothetical protein
MPFIYISGNTNRSPHYKMDKHCENCGQKDSCKTIYGKLGDSKLPPVLLNVVMALLLPLIFFIGTIIAAEKFFFEEITNSLQRNLLSLGAAIAAVGLYIAILKLCQYLLRSIKH